MDWKDKLNSLYESVPKSDCGDAMHSVPTLDAKHRVSTTKKQTLRVELDKRKGKPATLITEFEGTDAELKELARQLKVKCGVGGSARGGEILIQGDLRVQLSNLLEDMGYKIRRINFK